MKIKKRDKLKEFFLWRQEIYVINILRNLHTNVTLGYMVGAILAYLFWYFDIMLCVKVTIVNSLLDPTHKLHRQKQKKEKKKNNSGEVKQKRVVHMSPN